MFTDTGPLAVLAVVIAFLVGIVGPASAQFFNFGGFGGPPQRQAPQRGGGWFGGDFFQPFQQSPSQQQAPRQDFSRAPGPAKRDSVAERNVLVLGDAMADWLGYGLEDAYSEQPDMGVIRKHKTLSGLIKYQPRGEPADWTAAAKAILATEKPDAIVVMLGLNDRVAIREAITEKKTDENKFRNLFEKVQEGIFISAPDDHFLDFNDAFMRILGYESHDGLLEADIPSQLYVNPADRDRRQRLLNEYGEVTDFEFQFRRHDGEIRTGPRIQLRHAQRFRRHHRLSGLLA